MSEENKDSSVVSTEEGMEILGQPSLRQMYDSVRKKYSKLVRLWQQEHNDRMELQEDVNRLKEQNEQIVSGMHGFLRGRYEMSKIINMRLMEIGEAQNGIINLWKSRKQRNWNWLKPFAFVAGLACVLVYLSYNADMVNGFGAWSADNVWVFLLVLGVFAVVAIFYFRSRSRQ